MIKRPAGHVVESEFTQKATARTMLTRYLLWLDSLSCAGTRRKSDNVKYLNRKLKFFREIEN